jgi:ribonucleoside-diphosphate reductase alpha chain
MTEMMVETSVAARPRGMHVTKRDGSLQPVDVSKIVRAIERCVDNLDRVDPLRVATRTINGLYDGATTRELDELAIRTAASLITEEPQYSKLAARLLSVYVDKELRGRGIFSFSQGISRLASVGILDEKLATFVANNARKLDDAIVSERDRELELFGLRTLYDRYLLRDPESRVVLESAQGFFMRVACSLADDVNEAIALYELFSRLEYLPSSPTLFNSGTRYPQLSSCFLLDSPDDDLCAIYDRYKDVARLSKLSGGVGLAFHRVRSRGSRIASTNGRSNGIVPWLKTLDSSVAAVNQGGKRKGACCVYLEPWHADVLEFLELRNNTGDEARRTHNLNLACWVPDLFMKRVEADAEWSLFDPKDVPHLPDLFGARFEAAYEAAEAAGLATEKVRARELYARMMRSLAETGNGWMTFKDRCNATCNQTTDDAPADGEVPRVVHLSNLCTEIVEVTSSGETAVCNLGSVNLARHVVHDAAGLRVDFERLARTVRLAVRQLDAVIDRNLYPIDTAAASNARWRPVGLGLMGLQDVFFLLGLPFDAPEARALSNQISEEIYFAALAASNELAKERGAHLAFPETRAARGQLQPDHWDVAIDTPRWAALRESVREHGLRNSLLIAIAPTATIASIAGCYECIEPQVSNLFRRETLSGDFIQVNRYLVRELQDLGLWTEEFRSRLKEAEGSVQAMEELPEALRLRYRTAWELPMRSLIDMAAERGAFVDQSQSLNLFLESPNLGQLSSMYLYAWKAGLKTTYYLRSRPATRIAKATTSIRPESAETGPGESRVDGAVASTSAASADVAAVICSLENPESCEACQ